MSALPIAIRLLLSYLLVAALPLVGLAAIYLAAFENSLRETALSNMSVIADKKADQIDSLMTERLLDAQQLAKRELISEAVTIFGQAFRAGGMLESPAYQAADRRLRDKLLARVDMTGYHDMLLIDTVGNVVFSMTRAAYLGANLNSDPYRATPLAQGVDLTLRTSQPHLTQFAPYMPPVGQPSAYATAPILENGIPIGVVALRLGMDQLQSVSSDRAGLGHTGEALLFQQEGDATLLIVPLRHVPDAAYRYRLTHLQTPFPMLQALTGSNGQGMARDYAGNEVVAAWRYLPALRWGMVVKIDVEEVLAPLAVPRHTTYFALVLFLLFSGTAAYFLGHRLSRPIRKLTQVSERIAAGDFLQRAPQDGGAELDRLASAFNHMTDALADSRRNLEAKVKELEVRTQELRTSEERHMLVERAVNDGIWDWDIVTHEDYLSPRWKEILGYADDELPNVESSFFDLLDADDRAAVGEAIRRHLQEKQRYVIEFRLRHKDGSYRWVLARGQAMYDAAGHPVRMVGSITDITERKQAQQALQYERDRLRQILDSQFGFIIVLTPEGVVAEVNQTPLTLMGLQRAEVLDRLFWEIGWLEPSSESQIQTSIQAVVCGEVVREDIAMHFPGLGRREVDAVFSPFRDAAGQVVNVICFGIDITERKQMERLLEEKEEQMRTIVQAVFDGILIADVESRQFIFGNQAMCWMLGVSADELLTMGLDSIHPAAVLPELSRKFEEMARGECSIVQDVPLLRKGGSLCQVDISGSAVVINGRLCNVAAFHDITERKRGEDLLRASELRLNEAQRIAKVGNWEHDLVSGELYWSDEVFCIFEIDRTLFGASYEAFLNTVHPDDREAVNEAYTRSFKTRKPYDEITHRLFLSDGRIKYVHEHWETDFNAEGEPLRSVGTAQDITELKLVEKALLEAKTEAERANQAKSEILANMSHEIRTPLSAILGLSQLALGTALSLKQKDYLQKIHGSSKSLMSILNDILDYSKVEAGQMELERSVFQLESVLQTCSNLFIEAAISKGIRLRYEIACDVPPNLVGDSLRLGQILQNLLSNAIKFTKRGEIRLKVELAETLPAEASSPDVLLRFTMSDTGIGLTPEQIGRLFTAFGQVDTSITRKYGGTGLGLSISKRLVEMMGGNITVSSQFGQGSIFSFTARFGVVAASLNHSTEPATTTQRLKGVRILLVEDNAINQQVAQEFLQQAGAEVSLADNGRIAVAKVQRGDFDMVLMDLQMPGMDGFEATRRIRSLPGKRHLPIIAMTAAAMLKDQQACEAAGMNDFVSKPFDPPRLIDTLSQWVKPNLYRNASSAAQPLQSARQGDEFLDEPPGFDLSGILPRFGGDKDFIRKMLRQFGNEFAHAQSRLDSLVNAGQYVDAAHLLHQLKGVAGNVGAQALYEAAHTLELELQAGQTPATLPEFRAALALALDGVSRLGAAGQTGTVLSLEREHLTLLCRRLRDQLDNNDLVPTELLEELQSLLSGTPQAIVYQELQQQVTQLNYTQALYLLIQLAAETDIALWEAT